MGPCLGNNNVDQLNKIKNVKIEIGSRHLVVQEKVATGAYGDVWKCKDIKTGDLMAGKEIKLQTVGLSQMYQKEVKWLSKFSGSPGIVKYIGSKVMGRQKNNKSEGMESGIIVTEFYEISLFDLLKNNKFRVEQIHNFLTQILTALKFIHENGCIHLDLKMENILCRDGLSIKTSYFICDFGSSIEGQIKVERLDRKQKNKLKQFIESNSTLIYRAPELVELTKVPITGKTDIWMVGCVLYMLIFRKHPFEGQGQLSIVTANVNYNSKIQVTGTQSDSGKKLLDKIMQALKGMLQVNIENRLSQDQLLKLLA